MGSRIRWIAFCVLAAAVLLSAAKPVDAGTATMAISGTQAPGTPAGITFSLFFEPVLNDGGQVAFRGSLAGPGVSGTNDIGIWRGASGDTVMVAREGSAAPGTSAGVLFSSLQFPLLNNAGQVAFESSLSGTGITTTNDSGVWTGAPALVQLAAREGSNAPGTSAGVNFSAFFLPRLNDIGQVAFAASLSGSVSSTNNEGIWRGAAGAVERVVRESDFGPGIIFGAVGIAPALNDMGQVAHLGFLTGPGVDSNNDTAIWRGSPSAYQLVVRKGSQAPGTPTATVFSQLNFEGSFNNGGQIAFSGEVVGDNVDGTNNSGIWRGAPGAVQLVARAGNSAPGTPAGVAFTAALNGPALNESGQVAFWGGLTGGGVFFDQGIWRGSPGALQLIARKGRAGAGLPDGVTPFSLNSPVLNDSGQVAFSATLDGLGVNTTNDSAFYLGDAEELVQIVRKGQSLAGSTVTGIFVGDQRGRFNAFSQFTYHATLADGRDGVFLFTPEVRWRRNIGGSWDQATNWTASIPPGDPHDVKVDPAGSVTVLGPTAGATVNTLAIGGGTGIATLQLQQGGTVNARSGVTIEETGVLTGDGTINGEVTNFGTVLADNLTIQAPNRIENHGVITGDGRINGILFNSDDGEIRVESDQRLRFMGAGAHTNIRGQIDVLGGQLEFAAELSHLNGLLTGRNAVMRFNGGLENRATVLLSFGTSDIFGDVENLAPGKIILSGGSNATLYGDVINNGELRVSAGSTAVFIGDVSGAGTFAGTGKYFFEGTFSPGNSPAAVNVEADVAMGPAATMLLEIGGTTAGAQYDQLQVGGVLQAAGDLEVRLLGDFAPSFGQSFDLLAFTAREGWFDEINLPALSDGLSWKTSLAGQSFSVTVVPEPTSVALCAIGALLIFVPRMCGRKVGGNT